MTHLDKMRQMSDEEIAKEILDSAEFHCDHCEYLNTDKCSILECREEYRKTGNYPINKKRAICLNGIKVYLNSEVEV